MTTLDSTQRFSNRVADYVRYRPDYPPALIDWLRREHGVDASWVVADIGAGTGISSKMFLDAGHRVIAVEPNAPMRAAAQEWLGGKPLFSTLDGSAEATGLDDASVDLVSAAQAFHWFDPERIRHEWARVLRRTGLAAVYWNSRRLTGTAFLEGYEKLLLDYGSDYASVAERYADDAAMRHWFGAGWRGMASFAHGQLLDFDALRGRLLSSSYVPRAGHPRHEPMLVALRKLFDATQVDGRISFDYDTRIFVGGL
jgi:SAM-dependent methyltransferase